MEVLKNNADKLNQTYFAVCLIAFIGASISQVFFQKIFADLSVWVYADGWQREIGIWNLGIIIFLVYALWVKNEQLNMILTVCIVVITGLFGTNHLFGMIIYQKIAIVNLSFTILNYIATLCGIGILVLKKLK